MLFPAALQSDLGLVQEVRSHVCSYSWFHVFTWLFPCVLDLFEKMVPVSVQQSLAMFSQRKADVVNRSIAQMREATTLANG